MEEKKEIIQKLKERIRESLADYDRLHSRSWDRRTGVLLSRNEANTILRLLKKEIKEKKL